MEDREIIRLYMERARTAQAQVAEYPGLAARQAGGGVHPRDQ